MNFTDQQYWEKYYSKSTVDKMNVERICGVYSKYWDLLFSLVSRDRPSFLEIGAYPGRYLAYVADRYKVLPYGLDFNQDMSKVEQAMNVFGVKEYNYIQGNFFEFQPKEQFDVVYSNGFIEHFENFDEVLDKHAEWTKPGGAIMIMIPNKRYLRYLYGLLCDRSNLKAHNLKCMSLQTFRSFAKRNGLSVKYLNYFGGFPYRVHQPLNFFQRILYSFVRISARFINPIIEKYPNRYLSSTIIAIFKME